MYQRGRVDGRSRARDEPGRQLDVAARAGLICTLEYSMHQAERRELIVVCAGGYARELASYVRDLRGAGEPITIRSFVDDHRFEATYEGAPLLGGLQHLRAFLEAHPGNMFSYICAVSNNQARLDVVRRVERLGASNLAPWTARHPNATISDSAEIGTGVCVAPGAIVTARATIGDHCILNVNSSVSHDSLIEPFVHVSPSASICGGVTIGEGCYIGPGATVVSNVQIGAWSIVGAGAVVTDDVPAYSTVATDPARIVQRRGRGTRQPKLVG